MIGTQVANLWILPSNGVITGRVCYQRGYPAFKFYLQFNVDVTFHYFTQIAKLLPFLHAMMNPIIYW